MTPREIQFHSTLLVGLDAMSATTIRSFPRHTHDQYGLGFIDVGGHISVSDRRQVRAGPGNLIFVNPGEVHDGRAIHGQSRTWRILYFDPGLMNGLRLEIAEGDRSSLAFPSPVFVDPPMRTLFDAAFSAATGRDELLGRGACEALLLQLADRLSLFAGQRLRRLSEATPCIRRALLLIDADPASPDLTLGRLAREAGVSRYQLLRAFVREHCLTPHAYILQKRLNLARRLIRAQSDLADVAVRAGFYDQSHLTHAFVRQFGVTPARYASAGN